MRDWWQGTNGRWVSMGVFSDGAYGTPEGVMYSFPITCEKKKWTIVQVTVVAPTCGCAVMLEAETPESRDAKLSHVPLLCPGCPMSLAHPLGQGRDKVED